MKKILIIVIVLIIFIVLFKPNQETRIRVLANSNNYADQLQKQTIKNEIIAYLDSTKTIKISNLENIINNYTTDYTIEYTNALFPSKTLDNKLISGGIYPTILITLGQGKGENWWTVLYPDYYNIDYDTINSGNVYFKSYFYEKIKQIFD